MILRDRVSCRISPLLLMAACLLGLGGVFVHERSELWILASGAALALLVLTSLTR